MIIRMKKDTTNVSELIDCEGVGPFYVVDRITCVSVGEIATSI